MAVELLLWVFFEILRSPAKPLLVPQLEALLDKRANPAVGNGSGAQLNAQATPLDQAASSS